MMNKITINKIINYDYHRNGVCGIGFYAVDFVWSDRDYTNMTARAILFSNGDDTPTHYALTTEDVTDHWRGDHFVDVLWHEIQKQDAA